jgi:hypothetical protein
MAFSCDDEPGFAKEVAPPQLQSKEFFDENRTVSACHEHFWETRKILALGRSSGWRLAASSFLALFRPTQVAPCGKPSLRIIRQPSKPRLAKRRICPRVRFPGERSFF